MLAIAYYTFWENDSWLIRGPFIFGFVVFIFAMILYCNYSNFSTTFSFIFFKLWVCRSNRKHSFLYFENTSNTIKSVRCARLMKTVGDRKTSKPFFLQLNSVVLTSLLSLALQASTRSRRSLTVLTRSLIEVDSPNELADIHLFLVKGGLWDWTRQQRWRDQRELSPHARARL